jgi:hypothetical protein
MLAITNGKTMLLSVLISMVFGCVEGIGGVNQLYGQGYKMSMGTEVGGEVVGKVMRGPITPVERTGVESLSQPAAGITLIVKTPSGKEFASAVTNELGHFRIRLPPGTYRIETAGLGSMEFTKDLPVTVVVAEGQETRVEITIDTGMR